MTDTAARPLTRRERTFAATTEQIRAAARALIATEGSSALTMRALGRELGMTASGLYRYFDGRDAVLTALIVESYAAVGDHVEAAEAGLPAGLSTCARFLALVHALRDWAVAHPQEWALIFGSPVPGYHAPPETLDQQLRTSNSLVRVLVEALSTPDARVRVPADELAPELREAMAQVCGDADWAALGPAEVAAALACWCSLLGAINVELFGQLPPHAERAPRALFDYTMRGALLAMGLGEPVRPPA